MIIGISGKQRTGKDTFAGFLKSALHAQGYAFSIKSLSSPIKIAYAQSIGITLAELEATKADHREALQSLGNGARQTDPDIWIKKLIASCQPNDCIIIADVRYQNEYKWIRDRGGMVIRIETDRLLRARRGDLKHEDHISEVDLDGLKQGAFDKIVYNNSDQRTLSDNAHSFIRALAPRLCEFIL
jgi:phosphomevalonate kinase